MRCTVPSPSRSGSLSVSASRSGGRKRPSGRTRSEIPPSRRPEYPRQMAANDPSVARRDQLIRIRWALWGAVFLLAVAAAILYGLHRHASPKAAAVPVLDAPAVTWAAGVRRAPDFRLTDQYGKPVSLAGLHGRPVLVTFIDPLCRNYCPIEAQRLNDVVNALPPGARPAIV